MRGRDLTVEVAGIKEDAAEDLITPLLKEEKPRPSSRVVKKTIYIEFEAKTEQKKQEIPQTPQLLVPQMLSQEGHLAFQNN